MVEWEGCAMKYDIHCDSIRSRAFARSVDVVLLNLRSRLEAHAVEFMLGVRRQKAVTLFPCLYKNCRYFSFCDV